MSGVIPSIPENNKDKLASFSQFLSDCRAGALPQVAARDEHVNPRAAGKEVGRWAR